MHLSNERSNSDAWPCSGWNGCVTVKTWECASRGAMGGLRQRLRGTRHRSIRRECLDHVIIMNEVEPRPCSGTTSRTTIEVARTQPRSWDSGAASGRVTAPPVDDHRGPRHRHATRRDAGASVRGRRRTPEDDHPQGCVDEEPARTASSPSAPLGCSPCSSGSDPDSACQQRFREINLHGHGLRHEYASRLVERGVPLAQVRELLGHASILTTERYDNGGWRHFRQPSNGWRRQDVRPADGSRGQSFKSLSKSHRTAIRRTRRPPLTKTSEVTDGIELGELVPLRGFEPRSRG